MCIHFPFNLNCHALHKYVSSECLSKTSYWKIWFRLPSSNHPLMHRCCNPISPVHTCAIANRHQESPALKRHMLCQGFLLCQAAKRPPPHLHHLTHFHLAPFLLQLPSHHHCQAAPILSHLLHYNIIILYACIFHQGWIAKGRNCKSLIVAFLLCESVKVKFLILFSNYFLFL